VSNADAFLDAVARRGGNLGNVTSRLLHYVNLYGADEVVASLAEALDRGTPHVGAVRFLLERRRRAAQRPVPIAVELPDDPRVKNLTVRTHSLASYDRLKEVANHGEDENTQPAGA